ncbi:hypothetical protein [Bacillus sp. CGMCC 1.16541]|uniref:hypothetical protein n=1 Tax=Bacillus sp. CGMCC 1.16541 TaxID=2185143 RepID=UPI000D729025|nr:hypothetical protein [Bacillus sp. CGMCC 1.16541]
MSVPLNALIFVQGGLFNISVHYLFALVLALGYLSLLASMLEKVEHSWSFVTSLIKAVCRSHH